VKGNAEDEHGPDLSTMPQSNNQTLDHDGEESGHYKRHHGGFVVSRVRHLRARRDLPVETGSTLKKLLNPPRIRLLIATATHMRLNSK
jgi:hypothetical protein